MKILGGPWDETAIEAFLAQTVVPVRLASIDDEGFPVVVSLWFVRAGGAIWCATQASSRVAKRLGRDARCGFEIAADDIPYRGVRGRARVVVDPASGDRVLRMLLDRYLGGDDSRLAKKLLARVDTEVALRLDDLRVSSWDFTRRMAR